MLPDVVNMLSAHLESRWEDLNAALARFGLQVRFILPYYTDIGFEMMPCIMLEDIGSTMEWHAIPRIGELRQSVRLYGYIYHEKPEVRRAAMVALGITAQVVLNELPVPREFQGVQYWWEGMLCPSVDFGVGFVGNSTVGAFTSSMEVQCHVQL